MARAGLRTRKKQKVDEHAPVSDDEEAEHAPDTSEDDSEEEDVEQVKATTQNRGRKRERAPARTQHADTEPAATLFEAVQAKPNAIEATAKAWADRYKHNNRNAAVHELLMFIIETCGVAHFSARIIQEHEDDMDKLVSSVADAAMEQGLQDHFGRSRAALKFRMQFEEMCKCLMQAMFDVGVELDNLLLDALQHVATALSTRPLRHLRYMGTLFTAQLVRGWCQMLTTVDIHREDAQRDIEIKLRARPAGHQDVVARQQQQVERCVQKSEQISNQISRLHKDVLAARYRDVAPEVRTIVVSVIGELCKERPGDFLQDSHLRYIAWALSDEAADVRLVAVQVLLQLYSNPDNASPLQPFKARFLQRFQELAYDVDDRVAAKGLELLARLVQCSELDWGSAATMCKMLLESSDVVRTAAAQLVVAIVDKMGKDHLQEVAAAVKSTTARGTPHPPAPTNPSSDLVQLSALVRIVAVMAVEQDMEQQEHQAQLREVYAKQDVEPLPSDMVQGIVDVLYDKLPALKNWSLMIQHLQKSHSEMTGELDLLTTALLQVLRAAVHRAVQPAPSGLTNKAAADWNKSAKNEQSSISSLLVDHFPKLLARFKSSATQATPLVTLLNDVEYNVYSLKNKAAQFESLLTSVVDIMFMHTDTALVEGVCVALAAAAEHAPTVLQARAVGVLDKVGVRVRRGVCGAVDALQEMEEVVVDKGMDGSSVEENNQVLFTARASLLRLHRLSTHSNVLADDKDVYKAIRAVLEDLAQGKEYGPSIACLALLCGFTILLWHIQQLKAAATGQTTTYTTTPVVRTAIASKRGRKGGRGEGDPQQQQGALVRAVTDMRAAFVMHAVDIAEHTKHLVVKQTALGVLADLFLLLSPTMTSSTPGLEGLVLADSEAREGLEQIWAIAEPLLNRTVAGEGGTFIEPPEAHPFSSAKLAAVAAVGRLALHYDGPEGQWLGGCILSHMTAHGEIVGDAISEVLRALRRGKGAQYTAALFESALMSVFAADEDGEVSEVLVGIAQGFASRLQGRDDSKTIASETCRRLMDVAVGEGNAGLLVLAVCFAEVVPADKATELITQLQNMYADDTPDEDEEQWESYFALLHTLQGRVEHKRRARRKAPNGKKAVRFFDDEEEEEEDDEEIEEDDDEGNEDHVAKHPSAQRRTSTQPATNQTHSEQRAHRAARRGGSPAPTNPSPAPRVAQFTRRKHAPTGPPLGGSQRSVDNVRGRFDASPLSSADNDGQNDAQENDEGAQEDEIMQEEEDYNIPSDAETEITNLRVVRARR